MKFFDADMLVNVKRWKELYNKNETTHEIIVICKNNNIYKYTKWAIGSNNYDQLKNELLETKKEIFV